MSRKELGAAKKCLNRRVAHHALVIPTFNWT